MFSFCILIFGFLSRFNKVSLLVFFFFFKSILFYFSQNAYNVYIPRLQHNETIHSRDQNQNFLMYLNMLNYSIFKYIQIQIHTNTNRILT